MSRAFSAGDEVDILILGSSVPCVLTQCMWRGAAGELWRVAHYTEPGHRVMRRLVSLPRDAAPKRPQLAQYISIISILPADRQ